MNKLKIPEFIALFEEFKKSEDYAFRIKQSDFTMIAKEIIEETLKNEPLTNVHLTGLIQMLKADTSPESFIKYLSINIPDKNIRENILQKKNQLVYTGYTGAGKAAIRVLSPTQLSNVKIFLNEAFKILTISQAKNLTDNFDDLNIPELKQGIYSPWLHYIKPDLFPIINSAHNDLLQWFEMDRKYSSCIDDFSELKRVTGESQLGTLDYFAYKVKLNPSTSSKKHRKAESNEDLADRLLRENADQESILKSFRNIYKDKKNITDEKYVEERAEAYMRLAKRKALKSGQLLPSYSPAKISGLAFNDFPKNIILYGPPGTGKTFNSIDKATEIAAPDRFILNDHSANKRVFDELRKTGQIEFVTFHQNYSYEDFVVGISPDVTSGTLRFDKREGIFKQLAERAKQNWLAANNKEQEDMDFTFVFNSFFAKLIEEEVTEVEIPMKSKNYKFKVTSIDVDEGRIKFTKQSGGTGHDLLVKNVKRIYEGTLDYGTEGLAVYYNPLVEKLKDFAKDLEPRRSAIEKLKNFVLVIDEINRANISKVFGELITLLEDDKRLGEENELKITLPNGEKDFVVPPNLYIIGTMNTADKSIALIDIALRRRFEFLGYYPKYKDIDPEASSFLQKINANIFEKKKSADYLIGHAYFMKHQPIETVLRNKVIPLLMEYFSGKTDIVREIFDDSTWSVTYDSTAYTWLIEKG